jgi:phospholipase/carboxylesterase
VSRPEPVVPELLEAIGDLLPPVLEALERICWVQRHLYPPVAERLAQELVPCVDAIAAPLRSAEGLTWPADLRFMRDRLVGAARETLELIEAFVEASRSLEGPIGLYRALRRFSGAQETLYPLAPVFEPVSRWFLEPARRGDDDLVAGLRGAALRDGEAKVGVLHASNERTDRGGFSLYVPEYSSGETAMPLIVALHGGHGHGRDFLWSWLREARSRGMLLLAPTSRDRTWSMMGDDTDAEPLREMVESVAGRYPVDRERVLLTGMSDGATYALLCGLRERMPFSHLAPACGVLHPALFVNGDLARAQGKPIYLVHGALDWMFPVATARMTSQALEAAGARLVYREIEDLSHTYPRDENPKILDWLTGAPTA